MNNELLFVYGTLRSEFHNEFAVFLRKHSEFIGKAKITGNLYDLGWYPGLVAGSEKDNLPKVTGEVFKIKGNSSEIFAQLDDYECFGEKYEQPNEFVRKIASVDLEGTPIDCQVYFYNHSIVDKIYIHSGDYSNYLKSKK